MGEIYSILCAVCWASAVICMRKSTQQMPPMFYNLFKTSFAIILFIPTIILSGERLSDIQLLSSELGLLFLSGVIGLGVADTLWLKGLERTNASTIAILDCFYSPAVILLSVLFLGERLSIIQIIGGLLITSSVLVCIPLNRKLQFAKCHVNTEFTQGILYTVAGITLMGVGVVIMKPLLGRIPLFLAIEIRLLAGLLFLIASLFAKKIFKGSEQETHPETFLASFKKVKEKKTLFVGAFLGAYLAMIFWVAGTKYTTASIAAILNQLSTIFILILAYFFLKEEISRRTGFACMLGFVGIYFVSQSI